MLFNKGNNGSVELYEITGTFYAGTDFRSVTAEVEHATRVVGQIVGFDVVAEAEGKYNSSEDSDLVKLVQAPIAFLAVMYFSKSHLVSHEDTGSKIKKDGDETVPWEWMIERDNREQRERYYRALDSLLGYLGKTRQDWSKLSQFKGCLVSTIDQVDCVFPTDGSFYFYYMLLPLIQSAQRKNLAKFVSADTIAEAMASPESGFAADLREYVVLSALNTAVCRWSLEVFPLSIARRFAPSYQGGKSSSAATMDEIRAYLTGLEAELQDLKDDIINETRTGDKSRYSLVPENDRKNKFFTT